MSDAGLNIIVGANVQSAISSIEQLDGTLQDAEKELNLLGRAIDQAIAKGEDISKLEDAFQNVSDRIKQLKSAAAGSAPSNISTGIANDIKSLDAPISNAKSGLSSLGLNLTQTRVAFIDLGRAVSGQGFTIRNLGSQLYLFGPAGTIAAAGIYLLYEALNKQTDAEKKAEEQAKKLQETLLNLKDASEITENSTSSESGNIARVQALAAAIQDTNNTYKERKNALDELRETNKAYFGDLTLEALSLATLSKRVTDYSNALITEAIVKGQVDAIAKVSEEYQKQSDILKKLTDAKTRADAANANPQNHPLTAATAAAGGNEGDDTSVAASKATTAFLKQRDIVETLATAIASYRGELNKAIQAQIQQNPLQAAPKGIDDLKSIIPILEQIQRIYAEIAKPNKEPLFKQLSDSTDPNSIKLIQAQITEAIRKGATDGAKDPAIKQAYDDLATALQAKLTHIQNPDLDSHIQGIVDVTADNADTVESKIEKAIGVKGLELKVPVHLSDDIEQAGFDSEDAKKIKEGLEKSAGLSDFFINATASGKISLGKFLINQADLKNLQKTIKDTVGGVVTSGFADIGVALGDALSGTKNPFQNAVKNFTEVMGDGLIKIGETMIAGSTAVKVIQTALVGLFGDAGGGIIAGVAAVAVGEAVKNVGAHAFATGGIVTGPTNAIIGEAGPEVVFPLNQLNRFIKNTQGAGTQNINVTGSISGNNIRLALARTNKQQNLV